MKVTETHSSISSHYPYHMAEADSNLRFNSGCLGSLAATSGSHRQASGG